ncbi:unnamed protein product [Gongylonema pulchrum]|uniref:Protein kinase domain-containing protein n=1 Tax=Gongylonema pulchrum TaxID=637853 RepID=A0A183E532_9BILA|nr:unnamed protein product [Gongylonema pulchrum]
MAPEVMLCETFPEKHYNKLADIWSFGITLIEMAEEKPPYAEMNPAKVVFKVIKADPPTLERPQKWSANFRNVVAQCLTKDPDNRPTAADVLMCVRSLISEMNAEQVTTEVVMGSDDDGLFDDEDDDDTATVSSVATNSEARQDDIGSKQQPPEPQLQPDVSAIQQQKKAPRQPAPIPPIELVPTTVNTGTTTVVELIPTREISAVIGTETHVLRAKRERAPSLPSEATEANAKAEKNTIAVVEINAAEELESPASPGSPGSSTMGYTIATGARHRAAVEDALNEPSPLPSLAPSPGFFPSERSDPTQPLRQDAITVTNIAEGGTKPGTVFDSRFTVDGGVQLLRQTKIDGRLFFLSSIILTAQQI